MAQKAKQTDDPGISDVHVDAPGKKGKKPLTKDFLTKLYDELKASGELTLDTFQSAVKKSRAHAGGKMKAANRALTAGEMSYGQIQEMVNAELREEFGDNSFSSPCFWYAQEIYPDHVIVRDSDEGTYYRIDYTMMDGECEFGEPQEVEQEFVPKAASEGNNILDLCAQTHGWALFNEFDFAEPPATMPLMPKPGTYTHQEYGKVKITKERNQTFADNLNNRIYQEHIPVDLEHQLPTSGAVGYITAAEVNEDGSVDGTVEWNERGVAAIEGDKFKYVSPMWFDKWTDPLSEKEYSDVVIGAALTTRPFFKDKALRPLIASERGIEIGKAKESEKEIILQFTALAPETKGESMTKAQIEAARALVKAADAKVASETLEGKTDADIKAARTLVAAEDARLAKEPKEPKEPVVKEEPKEFAERLATAEAEAKKFKEELDATKAEVKKANERAEAIEKQNRAMRFTELSKEWPGATADKVDLLEHLFTAGEEGEDGALFKKHLTTQNAAAAQFKEAGLFIELGSAAGGEAVSAASEAEVKVKKMMEGDPKLTHAQAYSELLRLEPKLYDRITAESN